MLNYSLEILQALNRARTVDAGNDLTRQVRGVVDCLVSGSVLGIAKRSA
ncbi:MAG: hypothetical protein U5R48_02890 [Gammaproteobacteria bacterium]|nr:hypothetical protein [Gammaproteobacteria bacterium]